MMNPVRRQRGRRQRWVQSTFAAALSQVQSEMKSYRPGRKIAAPSKQYPPSRFYLVLIEQEPLRRSAAADCTGAMARLERAREGWHRFERKDRPAFIRWRAREFGALLTKARELEVEIRDSQALIHDVEMEMRRGFQDAHSAYRRVMFRRENPLDANKEPHVTTGNHPRAAPKLSEFEQEALFQEWVHKTLGTNPAKMDDEAYSTSFEAFKSHMFRAPSEDRRPVNAPRPRPDRRAEPELEEAEVTTPVDERVKEIYRVLVRRLHPDLRADGDAAVSSIWHEVQEAYAANDVPQLEILLALSGINAEHTSLTTTVSEMRALFTELQRALRALEKSLREAEGDDAWNFAQAGANEDLRLRVERQLKADLTGRTGRLELLRATLNEWARGPAANRKVRPRQFA